MRGDIVSLKLDQRSLAVAVRSIVLFLTMICLLSFLCIGDGFYWLEMIIDSHLVGVVADRFLLGEGCDVRGVG